MFITDKPNQYGGQPRCENKKGNKYSGHCLSLQFRNGMNIARSGLFA
jgi:hypothetical protein